MIFKYAQNYQIPIKDEVAYLMFKLTEGSPFYIASLFGSTFPKDLTTDEGLTELIRYETLTDGAEIKGTWMEYMKWAFQRINDINAKNIVLYLSQHRDREVTRKELLEKASLKDMTDADLEKRLKALVKADIISQGGSNFRYRGIVGNFLIKFFEAYTRKKLISLMKMK